MTVWVEVLSGFVKWMPEGSGRDMPEETLDEGSSVKLEATHQPEGPYDLLRWKKQVLKDKAAPAVGSASSAEDRTMENGTFQITAKDDVVLVRVYEGTKWTEVLVTEITPLTLVTIDSNAVTAALYGVKAV